MTTQTERALYTRKEIAALMGVGVATVAEWEKQGCPAVYIGKRTNGKGSRPRYDLEKVKSWLENSTAARAAKGGKGAPPAPPAPVSAPAAAMGAPAAAAPAAGVDSVIQYLVTRAEIALVGAALHDCADAFMAEMAGCGWRGSDGLPVVDWKPMARAFALRWMKGGEA